MAEHICYAYYKEYGIPVKIARLVQTFGKGLLPDDNRVFAQFAKAAAHGTDIVLHTRGRSTGNYCGIDDAAEGIMAILGRGAESRKSMRKKRLPCFIMMQKRQDGGIFAKPY